MSKRARWFQALAGVLLGGGCLWLSLRGADPAQVGEYIREASWLWTGIAVAGVILISAVKALRWQWLYPRSAAPLAWSTHFSTLLIAQMLNLLVPIRLGEVARLGLMRQEQRPVGMTLGTIIVEKSLDLVATGLLLVLALPMAVLPGWLSPAAGYGSLLTGAGLLLLMTIVVLLHRWLLRFLAALPRPRRQPWARWVERLIGLASAVLEGIGSLEGGRLFPVLGLTAFIWLLSVGVIEAMLQAFGLWEGLGAALALMLALTFISLAPTPPALVGVVGIVTEEVLAPFGVARSQALALGTVLNVVLVGPLVVLGGWAAGTRLLRLLAIPGRSKVRRALGLDSPAPPAGEE